MNRVNKKKKSTSGFKKECDLSQFLSTNFTENVIKQKHKKYFKISCWPKASSSKCNYLNRIANHEPCQNSEFEFYERFN